MLSKKFRLTKRGSFQYVYRSGQPVFSGAIRMMYVRSASLRIGFSVSNKIGKAHERNKVKRRMRAAVRECLKDITGGYQIVFVASPAVKDLCYIDILLQIKGLFKKASMINSVSSAPKPDHKPYIKPQSGLSDGKDKQ